MTIHADLKNSLYSALHAGIQTHAALRVNDYLQSPNTLGVLMSNLLSQLETRNLTICDLRPLALRVGAKEPTLEAITEATSLAALDILTEVRRALRCPDDTDIVEFARSLDYFHGAPDWATVLARSCDGTGSEYAWFESQTPGARGLVRDNGHSITLPHKHAWSVVATRAAASTQNESELAAVGKALRIIASQPETYDTTGPNAAFSDPSVEVLSVPSVSEQNAKMRKALDQTKPASAKRIAECLEQLGQTKESLFHGGLYHADCVVLLQEPELTVVRTADGELISGRDLHLNPDRDGLAAEVLSRMTNANVAPEHIAELRAQGLIA